MSARWTLQLESTVASVPYHMNYIYIHIHFIGDSQQPQS